MSINIIKTGKDNYHRMKYHILLSFIIFLGFIVLSYYYPHCFETLVRYKINPNAPQHVPFDTVHLFLNNIFVITGLTLGGVFFSFPTIYLLIYNASLIGYMGFHTAIAFYMVFMIPHGIFEFIALILGGAIGFRITHAIITIIKGIFTRKLKINVKIALFMIRDCIIPLVIMIILLIIAAYIEANITIPLGQHILGF
ncbi:stage II sporulation protein M [Methanosphaera sp.]